jgi:hypothetical protein
LPQHYESWLEQDARSLIEVPPELIQRAREQGALRMGGRDLHCVDPKDSLGQRLTASITP